MNGQTFSFASPATYARSLQYCEKAISRINLAQSIYFRFDWCKSMLSSAGNRGHLVNGIIALCDNNAPMEAIKRTRVGTVRTRSQPDCCSNLSQLDARMIDGQVAQVLQQFNLNAINKSLWLWANLHAITLDVLIFDSTEAYEFQQKKCLWRDKCFGQDWAEKNFTDTAWIRNKRNQEKAKKRQSARIAFFRHTANLTQIVR